MARAERFRVLAAIPSFYGSLTWTAGLALYYLNLAGWNTPSGGATLTFLVFLLAMMCSTAILFPMFRQRIATNTAFFLARTSGNGALIILHSVGALGLFLYVGAVVRTMGGPAAFLGALQSQSYLIRQASSVVDSAGVQLSYFGWLAIWLSLDRFARREVGKGWLALSTAQLLGNLLFIDRTRPLWILFVAVLVLVPRVRRLSLRRALIAVLLVALSGALLFFAVGAWSGKLQAQESALQTDIPHGFQTIYIYATAGFAYFNEDLAQSHTFSHFPSSLAYPLTEALSKIGLMPSPPSQILPFYWVPHPTNVGTVLQPFYADGGVMFLAVGLAACSFGLDLLALYFLKFRHPLLTIAGANLCFVSFMAFFTPKIASTATWLFVGLGLVALLILPRYRNKELGDL